MYIKYADYQPDMQLGEDDNILMSLQDFLAGGKDLEGVPVTITPDGEPPVEIEEESPVEESGDLTPEMLVLLSGDYETKTEETE